MTLFEILHLVIEAIDVAATQRDKLHAAVDDLDPAKKDAALPQPPDVGQDADALITELQARIAELQSRVPAPELATGTVVA